MADLDNFDSAKAIAESYRHWAEKSWGLGRIVTEIFEEVAEAPDSANLHHRNTLWKFRRRRKRREPEITDRF